MDAGNVCFGSSADISLATKKVAAINAAYETVASYII
jgi:hypothetical protein